MRFYWLIFIVFFCSHFTLQAQKVEDVILQLAGDPAMKHGIMGFALIDQNTGLVKATYQPNASLIPASSLKVLTCAYGLEILGQDFKFKTELQYTGQIDKYGTLHGDVILKGYGDPTLGSIMTDGADDLNNVLNQFVNAIKKKGIKRIQGRIIGDATYLSAEGIYDSWAYYDLGTYYAAGVYGLNINDNLYSVNYRQSKEGSMPQISTTNPEIIGIKFKSEVVSTGLNDNAYIYGGPHQYHLTVRGSIPPGNGNFRIKGAMPEPPLQAAKLLSTALIKSGIKVSLSPISSLRDKMPDGKRTIILTHYSQDLATIIKATLLHSLNLNTEGILRQCGVVLSKENTIAVAVKAYTDFAEKLAGEGSGFFIRDGSGLSTANAVPALGFSKLMVHFIKNEAISNIILSALPVMGVSGTLKSYLENSPATGKITAKTGSMDRVRSFSGRIIGKSGQTYVFTLILNNYECTSMEIKSKIETFFTQLYLSL